MDDSRPAAPPAARSTGPEPPAVRIRDPGEVAAALPHLLGFCPTESVVVVGLGGPSGGRVGLTLRVDIPPVDHASACARALARAAVSDRPRAAVVAVVSEAADERTDQAGSGAVDLPHRPLVHAVVAALEEAALPVCHVLLVRGGRWWSYNCSDPCCRPGVGTALPAGVSELEVASVAAGVVVGPDRRQVAARIAPVEGAGAVAMAAAMERAGLELSLELQRQGRQGAREQTWSTVTELVARLRPGPPGPRLTDAELARVAWALRDPGLRDRALCLALGTEAAGAEALWTECTRRVPRPFDALPATLLAVCAWLRGNGALATLALARARDSDPGYGLAALLDDALGGCLPLADLRRLLVASVAPEGAVSSGARSARRPGARPC